MTGWKSAAFISSHSRRNWNRQAAYPASLNVIVYGPGRPSNLGISRCRRQRTTLAQPSMTSGLIPTSLQSGTGRGSG